MKIRVYVKPNTGGIIPLFVYDVYSILEIKKIIQDKDNVPISCQSLSYADQPLQDGQTLKDYSIESDSILCLETRYGKDIKLYIKTFINESFTLSVKTHETMKSIKKAIEQIAHIPTHQQWLTIHGKPLEKEDLTLEAYGVTESTRMMVTVRLRSKENIRNMHIGDIDLVAAEEEATTTAEAETSHDTAGLSGSQQRREIFRLCAKDSEEKDDKEKDKMEDKEKEEKGKKPIDQELSGGGNNKSGSSTPSWATEELNLQQQQQQHQHQAVDPLVESIQSLYLNFPTAFGGYFNENTTTTTTASNNAPYTSSKTNNEYPAAVQNYTGGLLVSITPPSYSPSSRNRTVVNNTQEETAIDVGYPSYYYGTIHYP